jgi:hypothetical protein
VESGTCEGGFWRVFRRGLECPAGRADADAQFPGVDLPRSAGGSESSYLFRVHGGVGAPTVSLLIRRAAVLLAPTPESMLLLSYLIAPRCTLFTNYVCLSPFGFHREFLLW